MFSNALIIYLHFNCKYVFGGLRYIDDKRNIKVQLSSRIANAQFKGAGRPSEENIEDQISMIIGGRVGSKLAA